MQDSRYGVVLQACFVGGAASRRRRARWGTASIRPGPMGRGWNQGGRRSRRRRRFFAMTRRPGSSSRSCASITASGPTPPLRCAGCPPRRFWRPWGMASAHPSSTGTWSGCRSSKRCRIRRCLLILRLSCGLERRGTWMPSLRSKCRASRARSRFPPFTRAGECRLQWTGEHRHRSSRGGPWLGTTRQLGEHPQT